jgi:hypothetical protein
MLIKVIYTCGTCGVKDREVIVPEREENQDVLKYVNSVAECIGADHASVSPNCRANKIKEVKIPVSKDGVVGKNWV